MTKQHLKQHLCNRWVAYYGHLSYLDYRGLGLLIDLAAWWWPSFFEDEHESQASSVS